MTEENITFKETNSWVGSIPIHWDISRIKYICKMNEKTLSEKIKDDLIIKYIDIGNVDSYGRVNNLTTYEFSKAPSRARRIVRKNDVLISTVRTYLGAIAYINESDENLVCSTGFAVLTPNEKVFPEFLGYFTRSTLFIDEIASRSYGVSYPAINSSEINSLSCILPNIEEQKLISNFLNKKTSEIDTLIEDKEKLIALLEEKRQAIITEAVSKGLNQDVKMKDSSVEWIGNIPEHWEEKRIKYLFREKDLRNNDKNAILLSLFTSIGVRPRSQMEDKGNKSQTLMNYKVVNKGDIVVNKLLAWMGSIGISAYDGVTSPDYDIYMPVEKEKISNKYYHYYFRSFHFKGDCYKYGRGIMLMRWRTYSDDFKKIKVTNPPLQEQIQIASHLDFINDEIDFIIQKNSEIISLLKEYRQALIYEAVTGKLDVQEMMKETEQEEVSSL